jgi:helicase
MHPASPPEPRALTPPQAEVLAGGYLDSGFHCLLEMPTGAGKTWLAEQAMASVLRRGFRAVYLTPLRALAGELTRRWRGRFAPAGVGVFTGDYGGAGKPFPVPFRTALLLVMTPERLDACTRAWRAHWDWLPEVDLLVVDEFHLLGDRHRGPRLEGTLSRFLRLNPFARVLGLSATLGNRAELADWLGAVEYSSTWRPVPLGWRTVRFRKAADKPALLTAEVGRVVGSGGKSLVFVQSRRRAEGLAGLLRAAGLRAAHHHAGLSGGRREVVEGDFRAGEADVLVATGTLEMGLNLPVRQVVLYDLQVFDGGEYRPLPVTSVWQRAGRAGRPGLDAEGEVVLLAPAWDAGAGRYAEGKFEPVRSGLGSARALAEQVVAEVASGLCRTADQLRKVFGLSLAARQGSRADVGEVVGQMCAAGMLRTAAEEGRGGEGLRATRLGHVATRHLLAPATALLFRRALGMSDLTFFDLLLVAATSDDCEPVLPVDFEELEGLDEALAREPSSLLALPRRELSPLLGAEGRRLLSALKRALVGRAWTRTGDAGRVAEEHGLYPFEVGKLVESLTRLLHAFAAVAEPEETATEEVSVRERLRVLQSMVEGGLDEEAATLTAVPGVGPKYVARLREAGIADVEALAQADRTELAGVRGLSKARAERWVREAGELVKKTSAWRYRERSVPAAPRAASWPPGVDPYRLRRALELRVCGGDGLYRVSGGQEPHEVRVEGEGLACDCADAGAGQVCKHVLAVRMARGGSGLRERAEELGREDGAEAVSVFGLWLDRAGPCAGGGR